MARITKTNIKKVFETLTRGRARGIPRRVYPIRRIPTKPRYPPKRLPTKPTAIHYGLKFRQPPRPLGLKPKSTTPKMILNKKGQIVKGIAGKKPKLNLNKFIKEKQMKKKPIRINYSRGTPFG